MRNSARAILVSAASAGVLVAVAALTAIYPASAGTTTSTPSATVTRSVASAAGPQSNGLHMVWADLFCDGEIDPVDALKTLTFVAGLLAEDWCGPQGPGPSMAAQIQINGIPRIWGDVDCDNDVDAVDSLSILRFVAGLEVHQTAPCPELGEAVAINGRAPQTVSGPEPDERQILLGDVRCDDVIDAVDALAVLRHIAAFPSSEGCGLYLGPLIGDEVDVGLSNSQKKRQTR